MVDLRTSYLGFELLSPIVASPSPMTGQIGMLQRLESAGVGAVVLPSLFEEEIEAEALTFDDRFSAGAGVNPEADDYFADFDLAHLGLQRHIDLTEQASAALSIPVIASVNGISSGGWVRYARDLVAAGAAAIELNMYAVAADPRRSSVDVELGYLDLIRDVRAAIEVPLAVKLSPYFTSMAHFATQAVGAGADGLVLFNRFYQPDLDLETLDVTPSLELSRPDDMRLPLRWIALLRPVLAQASLALTSGVGDGQQVAKALLAGADAVMVAAEVLREGPERVDGILGELSTWMREKDYSSVEQIRGSVAQHTSANPGAFERAQYQRVLSTWRV